MPRYNIAFLPESQELQKALIRSSLASFGKVYDRYILGPESLGHVTLCQFNANDDATALKAFASLEAKLDIILTLLPPRIRPGTLNNEGSLIAEIPIEQDAKLMERQRACFAHLGASGLETLTPVETYSPHLTLARLKASSEGNTGRLPNLGDLPLDPPDRFFLSVGISTDEGCFQRPITGKTAPA